MIPSQRHIFDIPDDVAYLNCACISPLMTSAAQAGEGGIQRKVHPWTITPPDFFSQSWSCRELFGQLVNADAGSISILPSVSYGTAVAAKNLPVREDQEIIVLEDQFPSHVYVWREKAREAGARMRTVAKSQAEQSNAGPDWTAAILEAIDENTAIVALPHNHWTDGALIDLVAVGAAARTVGAALVVDITQSGGALPFDVADVRPDFLVCACYKWLLGPYSLGFMYIDPKWHGGAPLEHNWIARRGSENFGGLVDYVDGYQDGALRFDMGERSSFQLMPIAHAALTQLLDWGVENIAETLSVRTAAIAKRATRLGLSSAPAASRAGHFLGLRAPDGIPARLPESLAKQQIYISVRGDSMRVTPHLYNSDEDVDRLFDALEREL